MRSSRPGDGLRERLGAAIGRAWAPFVARIAHLRHARMFHPRGVTFTGSLVPESGRYQQLAMRLGTHVLARLSPALWKNEVEYGDVLGIALRFRATEITEAVVREGDQDLLFATIRSPFTMPLSPFTTNGHDFMANKYWAVSPFEIDGYDHRVEIRLVPLDDPDTSGPRRDRLAAAVRAGRARFALELRETLTLGWHRMATLSLDDPAEIDQAALKFDPFHAGAGLHPVGVVHAIRRAVYSAGQRGRILEPSGL